MQVWVCPRVGRDAEKIEGAVLGGGGGGEDGGEAIAPEADDIGMLTRVSSRAGLTCSRPTEPVRC